VFTVQEVNKEANLFKFISKSDTTGTDTSYLVDSQKNQTFFAQVNSDKTITLVGADGYYYGSSKQGDLLGKKDKSQVNSFTIEEAPKDVIFEKNTQTGTKFPIKEGEKFAFRNIWGKYFGYGYGQPLLLSQICEETVFTSHIAPDNTKYPTDDNACIIFKSDYSEVFATCQGGDDVLFDVLFTPLKGYFYLVSKKSGVYLGSTSDGKLMCWKDGTLMTTFWKLE